MKNNFVNSNLLFKRLPGTLNSLLLVFILFLISAPDTANAKQTYLNKKMNQVLALYNRKTFPLRLGKILELVALSRARILANLAGSYADPKCKGKMIWMEHTLELSDVVKIDLRELDKGCPKDKKKYSCSKHFHSLLKGEGEQGSIDIDENLTTKVAIPVEKLIERAEIEFVESLEEYVKMGFSIVQNDQGSEYSLNAEKRSFLDEIETDGKSKKHSTGKFVEHLIKIEERLRCSFMIFEQLFVSIKPLIADYIRDNEPDFDFKEYDPYQSGEDPMEMDHSASGGWSGSKRSDIHLAVRTVEYSQEQQQKKRWQSGVIGQANCTVRGLYPIWGNIKCYTVRFLGDEYLLRMLYETNRNPPKGCLNDCSKKRAMNQDYDLNDFVAKFNFYHVYLSCSSEGQKKLMWALSDLIPEAKGSKHLEELRLSLDYLSDNFDGGLCNRFNLDHSNQNAREFLSEGKCRGGEISGGAWNERSLYTKFEFKLKQKRSILLEENYDGEWMKLNKLKMKITKKGNDVLSDINFSPISWKYCPKGSKNCSSEEQTNQSDEERQKARKKDEKHGNGRHGKRKFSSLGVDEFFVEDGKNDKYLYNTINRETKTDIKKYFTSLIVTRGDCGLDTDLVTPMYFLRSYETYEKGCCASNNCKDVVLADFFDSFGADQTAFTKTYLPSSLITKASSKWSYPAEGMDFFVPTDQTRNILFGKSEIQHEGKFDFDDVALVGRPSYPAQPKFCHYKEKKKASCDKDATRQDLGLVDHAGWRMSEKQCGCDFDCSINIPDFTITGSDGEMHQGHTSSQEERKERWEGKCRQPLGYCIKDMEDSFSVEEQKKDSRFSRIISGCNYWDECSSKFGSGYYCDPTFRDAKGNGFSFCAKSNSSEITDHPCHLNAAVKQCEDSICTAGMSGCYNDFAQHIDTCKEIFLSSNGKIRCQYNLMKLDISENIQNSNADSWRLIEYLNAVNKNSKSKTHHSSRRSCFYLNA